MQHNLFHANRWAQAFLAAADADAQEAFLCLKALAIPVKSIHGVFFGSGAAAKLESVLRDCAARQNTAATEYAIRFLCMLAEENCLKHIDLLLQRIEEKLDEQNGVLSITVEVASALDESYEKELAQMIKEKTGAAEIKMKVVVKPQLLGGYFLRAGSFYIDASIKGQIEKMRADLIEVKNGKL